MTAKLRLIKFGAAWCGACKAMDKTRVLEQFSAIRSDVELIKHEVPGMDDDGEWLEDPIADEYDAQSLPTLVFESDTGIELLRHEGGVNLKMLSKLYESALEELDLLKKKDEPTQRNYAELKAKHGSAEK